MQRIVTCTEHDNCTAIIGGDWPDEQGSWCSHMTDEVAPEARLNLDYPEASDERGT